ncbi:MAG: thioredoxin [Candidatus Nanoarchaeia archaeon]
MTNNDKVPELTNWEFDTFIKDGTVLIDFFAEWCMPCLMMAPVIDDLSEKFKGKVKIGKVNVGDNEEIARKFNISSIPHFIIFKDGEKKEEFTGSVDAEQLESKLNAFI